VKVVHQNPKTGEIKLIAENLDDLWHLYNIIQEGDLVRAVTFRTAEDYGGGDRIRATKTEKKRMTLTLNVEKVEFHEFSNRLRISGTIIEGPQDLGQHHTFNIDTEILEPITLIKENWRQHDLQRLQEAVNQRTAPVLLFVSLDEDAATIAILRQSGVQLLAEIDAHRSGKMYETKETDTEYYGEILAIVKTAKTPETPLVVIGPGFAREHFIAFAKSKEPTLAPVVTYATGYAGMNGIHEAIKSGIVDKLTKDNRVSKETQAVEHLLDEVRKDGLATYGPKEVEEALQRGAVQTLLISDVCIRSRRGEEYLDLAKKTNSDFLIINSLHEAGKKFESLGGVAALLRYKYEPEA
jgi:protein pelota